MCSSVEDRFCTPLVAGGGCSDDGRPEMDSARIRCRIASGMLVEAGWRQSHDITGTEVGDALADRKVSQTSIEPNTESLDEETGNGKDLRHRFG